MPVPGFWIRLNVTDAAGSYLGRGRAMLIDTGECGNCDAPVAIEDRDGEEGYICLNCGYEHWEPTMEETE
jgi:DNA-directed RNA polymerase subunit RPC12/RpoP